ncbi:MAG: hypothetical protein Q7T74_01675 [Candidatus Saccharibacteria bacterium]|nr:hypothetical protein [Candidatus Saccharibacteria bacterium]
MSLIISGIFFVLFFLAVGKSDAASLSSASATLTTSRPSASSPINNGGSPPGAAAGSGQLTIFNNSSRFLASDSAKTIRATGTAITNNNLIIASQSADLLTVYLGNTTTTFAARGADVLFVPITAMHSIKFTVNTEIPSGGKITLTYPGTANNTASPSATTFAFNNLQTGSVVSNPASGCNSVSISAPTITCTTNAIITAGTTVTVLVGCSAQSGGSCTTQVPTLINPTKSNSTAGAADIWKIGIQTLDSGDIVLDDSTIAIGTVESVTVRATIDPSLTFTIAGVANGVTLSSLYTGCGQLDTTNTGITSTATDISLGSLSVPPGINSTLSNIAAQTLVVTTNGANGYSITATSSGQLRNVATGFAITSTLVPQAFPASTNFFGIHACGTDTDLIRWTSNIVSACNTQVTGSSDPICRYGWPTQTSPILIAQRSTGPIGAGSACIASGCGQNVVSYAATQDVTLPPGIYQSVVTYVATPSF